MHALAILPHKLEINLQKFVIIIKVIFIFSVYVI